MYRCNCCGHLFEDGEQAHWVEMHGFTYGNGEEFSGCPLCKGDYAETTPCKACGNESFLEEEMEYCICDECIEEYSKDFDFCIKLGAEETKNVAINGAIASLFDAEKINEILISMAKNIKDVSFEKFVNEDRSWFAQMIADEVESK